jgi:capsular exopolysaccharide synthesis family protein
MSAPSVDKPKTIPEIVTPKAAPVSNEPRLTIIQRMDHESPAATEARRMVNHLVRLKPNGIRSVLVTSAEAGEGKSTVSALLSIAAAQYLKKRTLLLDGDLRRPVLNELFGISKQPGLADWLNRTAERPLLDLAHRTSLERLHVLTSGDGLSDPGDLLEADSITTLVKEFSRVYELVVIDSPPIMPVSDPLVFAPHVDATVVVIKAGVTRRQSVKRALQLVEQAGGHVMGCILNDIGQTLPAYYTASHYAYSRYGR